MEQWETAFLIAFGWVALLWSILLVLHRPRFGRDESLHAVAYTALGLIVSWLAAWLFLETAVLP